MKRVTGLFLFGCLSLLSTTTFADDKPADPAAPPAGGDAAAAPAPAPAPAPTDAAATPAPAAEAAAPKPAPPGSVVLKQGAIMVQVNIEMNLQAENMAKTLGPFKPVSIAPDIWYGATPELTVGLIHSHAATDGFRGAAGDGVCITGDTSGCPKPYMDAGLEADYSLMKGPIALAGVLGVLGLSHNDSMGMPAILNDWDVKIGAKFKYTAGAVNITANPSVWEGLNNRDTTNIAQLWIPVAVGYWVTPKVFTIGVATGIKGPFPGAAKPKFADNFTVPVGASAQYAINKQIAVGGSFVFGKITGASKLSDANQTGADFRVLQLWLNYSM